MIARFAVLSAVAATAAASMLWANAPAAQTSPQTSASSASSSAPAIPAPPGARGGRGGGRGAPGPQGPEPMVHDPVMIKEGDWYYVFRTSGLINSLRSKDLKTWTPYSHKEGERDVFTVFADKPAWTSDIQPNRADMWAPDISHHDGKFFLYYCISTFGSNRSAIGLATNKTLDPTSPEFKWTDQGMVIESQRTDFYNCIDPNAFWDKDGAGWLTFGSFYWNQGGRGGGGGQNPDAATKGGIMLVQLDPATGKIKKDAQPKSIASRAFPQRAIEAPFLVRDGDWYFLFVSWDTCCQGVRSTYRIMVGRSKSVTGPFLDKDNKNMLLGGGTQVLAGDGDRIIGPGHEGLLEEGAPGKPDHRWLLLYHFYDGHANGISKLQVRPVTFDTGWPVLEEVINKPADTPVPTQSAPARNR
ncbi:MAG TPA: arabinan endo-1,5-alpha-L-arabinosidase [Phycisphaerae bacterium]|nr:arabinan endo-1,5-alpha-L-arabinosidase [Phycisphaerae bacterium]